MVYHFNYNFIWKYFTAKLAWGLALSLELSVVCIAAGAVIGLLGALAHTDGPRWARAAVAAYVEFIRNVPLILLVYLVFYGIPTVGRPALRRDDIVRRDPVGLCRRLSRRGLPRRARRGPARPASTPARRSA